MSTHSRGGHSAAAHVEAAHAQAHGSPANSYSTSYRRRATGPRQYSRLSRKRLAPGADGEQGTASRTLVDTYMYVSHALHQHTSPVCRHARDDASSSPRVGARRALSQPGGASLDLERFLWAHHLPPEDNLTTPGVATIPLPR